MNWVKSLIIAFSMYSKIPMPHLNLEEKDMRYVMGFFPLVGLVLGACQFIWYKLSAFLGVPNVSRALIFLVLPYSYPVPKVRPNPEPTETQSWSAPHEDQS